MQAFGFNTSELVAEIQRIVVLTILSIQPFLCHNYRASFKIDDGKSRCFEILGFDILIDRDLKPWVLEVNHSPSLSCDSQFDADLKDRVITGALKIADIDPSFMARMLANEKARTMQRIEGNHITKQKTREYSYDREVELAKSTDWQLIFPVDGNASPDLKEMYDKVVEAHSKLGIGGMDETQASAKRKRANLQYLQEIEERYAPPKKVPGKVIVTKLPSSTSPPTPGRPTRSVLLRRKLQRLRKKRRKNQCFCAVLNM
jgi:tubulin polyglutamylase TTLL6/13